MNANRDLMNKFIFNKISKIFKNNLPEKKELKLWHKNLSENLIHSFKCLESVRDRLLLKSEDVVSEMKKFQKPENIFETDDLFHAEDPKKELQQIEDVILKKFEETKREIEIKKKALKELIVYHSDFLKKLNAVSLEVFALTNK